LDTINLISVETMTQEPITDFERESLAHSSVFHWRLLKRILNWDAIHRLCDNHDADAKLNREPK
jgi:hypothetical protein